MLYQLSYFRLWHSGVQRFHSLAKGVTVRIEVRCGRRWIRTTEVERQQIYSLPHLATLVSAQSCMVKMCKER